MTSVVERLNYAKEPPGYRVAWGTQGPREWSFRSPGGTRLPRPADGCDDLAEFATQRTALAAAWTHYKREHDLPGLEVERCGFGQRTAEQPWWMTTDEGAEHAAAWAWHDRRHALAGRLTLQDAWPRCLRWTDAECDQVDRWIADGEEVPEFIWVRLKPVDRSSTPEDLDPAKPQRVEGLARPSEARQVLQVVEWEAVGGSGDVLTGRLHPSAPPQHEQVTAGCEVLHALPHVAEDLGHRVVPVLLVGDTVLNKADADALNGAVVGEVANRVDPEFLHEERSSSLNLRVNEAADEVARFEVAGVTE